jgi:hypothetical protein
MLVQYICIHVLSITYRARKSVDAQAGRVSALRSSPDYLLIPNNPWMEGNIIEGRNQQIESFISQIKSRANISHVSAEMGDQIQMGTETVMSNTVENREHIEGVKTVDSTVTFDAYSVSITSNATSVLLDTNEDVVFGINVQNEGKGVETKEEEKEVIEEEKKEEKEEVIKEKEVKQGEKEEEPTVGTEVARASSISHNKVVITKPSAVDLKIQIENLPTPPSSSSSAISKETFDLPGTVR